MSKDLKKVVGDLLEVTNDRIESLAQLIKDHEASGAQLKKKSTKKKAKAGSAAGGGGGEEADAMDALQTGDIVYLQVPDEANPGIFHGDLAMSRCGVQEQGEREVRSPCTGATGGRCWALRGAP